MFDIDFADLAWLLLQAAAVLSALLLAVSHLRLRHRVDCQQAMLSQLVQEYGSALGDDDYRPGRKVFSDTSVCQTRKAMQQDLQAAAKGRRKSHDWN